MQTTKQILAGVLNENKKHTANFPNEAIRELAAQNNLVIAFGQSDDIMEFKGAVNDTVGCPNDGGDAYFTKSGLLVNPCDSGDDCPYHAAMIDGASKVTAIWHDDGDPCWEITSDIPHSKFDIMDDEELGEVWCKAIVFSLDDVK